MAEEKQATVAGELAEHLDGGLGAALDGLDGGEDGGVRIGGQFGDSFEIIGDGGDVSAGQGLHQGAVDLLLGVADEEDAFVVEADH